jgi:hypothetical protein
MALNCAFFSSDAECCDSSNDYLDGSYAYLSATGPAYPGRDAEKIAKLATSGASDKIN